MRKFGPTLAILIILFAILVNTETNAQGFAERVATGIQATDMSWSANSQTLSLNGGLSSALLSSSIGQWYEYNPTTRSLTEPAQWPRQPFLTSAEVALYQPATLTASIYGATTTENSFIFASPNGDHIIYASNVGAGNGSYPIMIAHRPSQVVAEAYTKVWFPTRGLEYFNVVWNRTGTAFVVATLHPESSGYGALVRIHATNFAATVTNLQATAVNPVIASESYFATEPLAISDDGNVVLMRGLNHATNVARLLIWNVALQTYALVGNFEGEKVVGATFEQGNPNSVLIINQSGLVRYTLSTQQTTLLNSQASSLWGVKAVFSPDSRWLAIHRAEYGSTALYVFDLTTDFVPTATPSVTGIRLQYYPESTTRTRDVESIIPTLNIVNATENSYNLSNFKIRYYFLRENTQPLQAVCAWTALPGNCTNVTVTAGLLPTPTYLADAYLEVGFTGGVLPANSQTFEIIVRANAQDWSDFYQWDDYSFDPDSTSDTFKDWDKVTLHYMGSRIWGWEPD